MLFFLMHRLHWQMSYNRAPLGWIYICLCIICTSSQCLTVVFVSLWLSVYLHGCWEDNSAASALSQLWVWMIIKEIMGIRGQTSFGCTANSIISSVVGKNENVNLQFKPCFSYSSLRDQLCLQCWVITWACLQLCLPVAVVAEGALFPF